MRFRNHYDFLSNFYPANIIAWGIKFPTAEHVYVAAKILNMDLRREIAELPTPGQAKRLGRKLHLRPDWEENKVTIMRAILRRKFIHTELSNRLSSVRGSIVEENTWHDNFWGKCVCPDCKSKTNLNWLGRLLEEVRDAQKT
jgi:ribA/ribD-fused uncharacterized protein